MNKKTLKFDNIKVNKKEFHKSNQPIRLTSNEWIYKILGKW